MKKIIISIIIISMFLTLSVFADENNIETNGIKNNTEDSIKKRILIYDLYTKDQNRRYEYYSFIVPNTIAKNLRILNKYSIMRIEEKYDSKRKFNDAKEKKGYIDDVITGSNVDFIVLGKCTIENKHLYITVQLIDVKSKSIIASNFKGDEIGVRLLDIVDTLSSEIDKNIQNYIAKDLIIEKKKRKSKVVKSPFSKFYNGLKKINFGIDAGYVNYLSDWDYLDNDSEFVSSYLAYNLNYYLEVSFHYDYFASENKDQDLIRSAFEFNGFRFNFHYFYNIYKRLSLELFLGIGRGKTILTNYPPSGIDDIMEIDSIETSSGNFYTMGGLSLNVDLNPVELKFGTLFSRVFIEEKPLDMYLFSIGLCYHL
jgi:hypothetical protein